MVFKRKIDNVLEDWKRDPNRKSLLLAGARQVGKTTSVREFGKGYGSFVEINLELRPNLRRIFSGDLDIHTMISRMRDSFGRDALVPGDTLILLDEIQSCPPARTALKAFTEDPDWDVIATGSLLGVNYRDVPSYPVGYERRVLMHPMDFEEYLWATGVTEDTISDVREHIITKEPLDEYQLKLMDGKIREYMAVGGLPEAVVAMLGAGSIEAARMVQDQLREQYRNDAAKYASSGDRNRIYDCFRSAADQLAKEGDRFRYGDIGRSSDHTVYDGPSSKVGAREYRSSIDWLLDAGICLECKRISELMPPARSKENLFRLYFCDMGILSSMMPGSVRSILDPSIPANKGPIGENLVATLLHTHGIELHYYKKKTTEVDFITGFDGIMTALEVKTGNNTKSKSLDSVMKDGLVRRGIKFGAQNISVDGKGVETYPLFVAGFPGCLFVRRPLLHPRIGE